MNYRHPGKWLGLGCLGLAAISSHAFGEEWVSITEADAALIFYGPGLEDSIAKRSKAKTDGVTVERAVWQSGKFPLAEFQAIEAGTNIVYVAGSVPSFREQIRGWYEGGSVEFYQDGTLVNALGRVSYQRFHYDTGGEGIECVGVRQFFGSPGGFDIVRGIGMMAEVLGTKVIFGSYCIGPGRSIDSETIEAVVRGIGFKGYAVPSDLSTLGSDPSRAPQEQELPPPMPAIGGISGGGSCDEPGAEYNSSCQEWFRAMETWRQRQKAK